MGPPVASEPGPELIPQAPGRTVPARRRPWRRPVVILSAAAVLAVMAGAGAALAARGSHLPGTPTSSSRTTSPRASAAGTPARTATAAATPSAATGIPSARQPPAPTSFAVFAGRLAPGDFEECGAGAWLVGDGASRPAESFDEPRHEHPRPGAGARSNRRFDQLAENHARRDRGNYHFASGGGNRQGAPIRHGPVEAQHGAVVVAQHPGVGPLVRNAERPVGLDTRRR
jgi:hypothetical protein